VPPFTEDWEADPAPLAVAELRRLIADPGSSQPPPSSLTAPPHPTSDSEEDVMTNTSTARRAYVPAAGRYRLDPASSSVTFRTRHLFGLGAVSGTMAVISGEVTIDAAAGQATMTAALSTASFDSGNPARDRAVRSARFLDASQYRHITYRAGTLTQADGRWMLSGELTVRRVSSPVTLTIESVEPARARFRVRATTRIDRYALGVTAAKGMAARHLDIDLAVTAEQWSPQG
jgi:polyisoprenoid-binding protein YceI